MMEINNSERGGNNSRKLLLDRDKAKDREDHDTLLKEG